MARKPDLAAVSRAAGSKRTIAEPTQAASAMVAQAAGAIVAKASSREGTRAIVGHFSPEVGWQLRELAVRQRTTVQALLGEALNDLFQKHNLPEIAK